jgi:hypothetical protein
MDEVEIFFCQFPNLWALSVSGMGVYTSKCEKSQNHCTLMRSPWLRPSFSKSDSTFAQQWPHFSHQTHRGCLHKYVSFLVPLLQIMPKIIYLLMYLAGGPWKMILFWALKRQVSQSRFFNLRDLGSTSIIQLVELGQYPPFYSCTVNWKKPITLKPMLTTQYFFLGIIPIVGEPF